MSTIHVVKMFGSSRILIAHIFPTVLGLYGDRGNSLVLAHRARARGLSVETVTVDPGQSIPRLADIYVIGGGEDLAQAKATELLRADGGVGAAISRGAVILAVSAGLQILGTEFPAGGRQVPGLGLIDAITTPGATRAVGELVTQAIDLDVPLMTGFENHAGRTKLGSGTAPLGRVLAGVGNGSMPADATGRDVVPVDGFLVGNVVGTYLHGPVLARNPALADLLLTWATGQDLAPLDDSPIDILRAERLSDAMRHPRHSPQSGRSDQPDPTV